MQLKSRATFSAQAPFRPHIALSSDIRIITKQFQIPWAFIASASPQFLMLGNLSIMRRTDFLCRVAMVEDDVTPNFQARHAKKLCQQFTQDIPPSRALRKSTVPAPAARAI
jgi:hypothetical protein